MQPPTLREVAQVQASSAQPLDWSGCLSVKFASGVPFVDGTRIPPDLIVERYARGAELDELSATLDIPRLNLEDILIFVAQVQRERDNPPEVRIDWRGCPAVERVLGRMSGIPVVIDSRVPADSIVENFVAGSSIEEIAYNFTLPPRHVKALLSFALRTSSL